MLQSGGIHNVRGKSDTLKIRRKNGRSVHSPQQKYALHPAHPQASYRSSSRTLRTGAGSEGIKLNVSAATLCLLPTFLMRDLGLDGIRISTPVPSGTGSGFAKMTILPCVCPLYS